MLLFSVLLQVAGAMEPGNRLAAAHLALLQDQPDAADELLSTPLPSVWTGYQLALQGAASLKLLRAPDAVEQLQAALDDPHLLSPLRDVTELELARALLQIEDFSGANVVLTRLLRPSLAKQGARPAPMGVDPGEVRWLLAQAKAAMADPQGTRKVLQRLWTHNPTCARSEQAASRLAEMGYPIDPETEAGQDLIETRIQTLDRLYETEASLELRERLPEQHPLRKAEAHAEAVFRSKDYSRAAMLIEALPSLDDDQHVLLALARIRSGDAEGSIKAYENLAGLDSPSSETAHFKIGYISWDQGHFNDAIRQLDRYLDRYPSGKHADSALWFKALALVRIGKTSAANRAFATLENSWPSSGLRPGAAYWAAMTSPDPTSTSAGLDRVRQIWPMSSYAYFATAELGRRVATPAVQAPVRASTPLEGSHWTLGQGLAAAGLEAWAREHLMRLAAQSQALDLASRTQLAGTLVEAGAYRTARKMVKRWCGQPQDKRTVAMAEACWPKPSGSTVSAQAQAAGLPAHLPFAIMNAESALDPAVTSPAGARGLMQLMPSLAEQLHPLVFPDSPYHPDLLYGARYNASLGTTELTRLAEQFSEAGMEDPLPLVIAGYNGGAEAVGRWLTRWQPEPGGSPMWGDPKRVDLWAEFIGYTETRKYVRRVLGFLQTYRLVYGDQPTASTDSARGSSGPE